MGCRACRGVDGGRAGYLMSSLRLWSAATPALAEDPVVIEPGDGVLGDSSPFAEPSVVAVFDDPSVWPRGVVCGCNRFRRRRRHRTAADVRAGSFRPFHGRRRCRSGCLASVTDGHHATVGGPADDLHVDTSPLVFRL